MTPHATEESNSDLEPMLHVAREAALLAGDRIKELRNSADLRVEEKASRDLVTTADIEADRLIIEMIRDSFPEHGFLTEETCPTLDRAEAYFEPLWIIDPVDGTVNYAHNNSQVGISIAFALQGIVELGVVNVPFQGELFEARRGSGAFCNGLEIQVSDTSNLKAALVGTGFPYGRDDLDPLIERLVRVLKNCQDIRRFGAAAVDICWVACGRLDGFYENLSPWDIAAASLIAREAGALRSHFGDQSDTNDLPADLNAKGIVLGTPKIFEQLLEVVRGS